MPSPTTCRIIALPGVVVLGLKDSGACAGLSVTDDLLKKLADIERDGSIIPLPHMQVEKLRIGSCTVAAVGVWPSDAPPVRWRQQIWVRVGPSTQAANQQQERMLGEKRRSLDLPFDIRPLPSASLAEMDAELFRARYLSAYQAPSEPNRRSPSDQLVAVRFASAGEEGPGLRFSAYCAWRRTRHASLHSVFAVRWHRTHQPDSQ